MFDSGSRGVAVGESRLHSAMQEFQVNRGRNVITSRDRFHGRLKHKGSCAAAVAAPPGGPGPGVPAQDWVGPDPRTQPLPLAPPLCVVIGYAAKFFRHFVIFFDGFQ